MCQMGVRVGKEVREGGAICIHIHFVKQQKLTRHCEATVCVCVCVLSHSLMSNSLWPHGLRPARLLCPWDFFPGKNAEMGCYFFLQGIFLTQGLNPCLLCLLHCREILYHWATGEAPKATIPQFFLKKWKRKIRHFLRNTHLKKSPNVF